MNVLVTGAGGMVGSHMVELLYQQGHRVTGIWHKNKMNIEQIELPVHFVQCDLRYGYGLDELIMDELPEQIYHLAAQSYPTVSWVSPAETIDVNINGTVAVFEAIKKARKYKSQEYDPVVVVACSSAEYGETLNRLEGNEVYVKETAELLPLGKVRNLIQKLVREVITIDASAQEVNENIFLDKINSLRYNLSGQENPIIDKAIQILENHSWCKFKKTSCHGDLTLENIIVKDNELYLIDFLDSFYDCWILDISTLMQDVQTLWSYRYEKEININTLIRLVIFRDILMETVQSIAPDYYIEVYYALLLKLIRIFPYTKDVETINFLNEKTKSIIEVIRLLEEQ